MLSNPSSRKNAAKSCAEAFLCANHMRLKLTHRCYLLLEGSTLSLLDEQMK